MNEEEKGGGGELRGILFVDFFSILIGVGVGDWILFVVFFCHFFVCVFT